MNIILWLVGFLWIIGWVRELAITDRGMKSTGIVYPSDSVRYAMPAMLFFAWPYFYFYGIGTSEPRWRPFSMR